MISDEFNSKIWIYFETNLKPRTRKEYFKIINDFNKEIGHDPLTLTSKEAKQYYNYLLNKMEHNLISYSTGVMRLSVIRSICNFIEYYNINHGNKYINYFKEYSLPEPDRLIDEKGMPNSLEINNILEAIKECDDKKAFLIFSLAVKCALTNSEICKLNMEYIVLDKTSNSICINYPANSRNNIARTIKIPDDVAKLLDEYIYENNIKEGPVFINKRKNRMQLRDSERLIEKYCKICLDNNKIRNKYTLQALRHAGLSYMLAGGAPKDAVANYAGITGRWMTRYDRIITSKTYNQAVNYSIITIQ